MTAPLGSVVIIEDESAIREAIVDVLSTARYATVKAADGETGLAAARRPGVQLVLLDLMLPKMDGVSLLRALRKTHPSLPVIIISALGGEEERVAGLKAGADDYIVKPFSAKELLARVEAVLRRSPERPAPVDRLKLNKASVDLARREIVGPDGQAVALSETECSILTHLAANAGRAVARAELLSRLWGLEGGRIETRTIDMHIARLRAKLSAADGGDGDAYIATVRGKGYMLGRGVRAPTTGTAGSNQRPEP